MDGQIPGMMIISCLERVAEKETEFDNRTILLMQ